MKEAIGLPFFAHGSGVADSSRHLKLISNGSDVFHRIDFIICPKDRVFSVVEITS